MTARIRYERRAALDPGRLQALFAEAWGGPKDGYENVLARSFTWVTARAGNELVGFVNVAWDGGAHFFLLDTTVDPAHQGRGIGRRLVEEAVDACRGHGEWMHVDADEALMERFYVAKCGFTPTPAGLLDLNAVTPDTGATHTRSR